LGSRSIVVVVSVASGSWRISTSTTPSEPEVMVYGWKALVA
jgi:hypothetical protein